MDYVEKFRKGEKPTLVFIKAAISDPSDDSAREGCATIAESLIIATWVQEVVIPSLIMCKTFDEVSDKHKHPLGGHAKQLLDSLNTLLEGTNASKGMYLGEQRDDTEPDFEFSFLHDMTNGIGMILPFEDKGGTPC
jgi:hypothetical protein